MMSLQMKDNCKLPRTANDHRENVRWTEYNYFLSLMHSVIKLHCLSSICLKG